MWRNAWNFSAGWSADTSGQTVRDRVAQAIVRGDQRATAGHGAGRRGQVPAAAYNGSVFTGVTAQSVNNDPTHKPDPGTRLVPQCCGGAGLLRPAGRRPKGCKFAKITATYGGQSAGATLSVPSKAGGILSLMVVADTSKVAGMQCARAMTLRAK